MSDKVKTPLMLPPGDNEPLVNPAEIEEYFTVLKGVGVAPLILLHRREPQECAKRSTSQMFSIAR